MSDRYKDTSACLMVHKGHSTDLSTSLHIVSVLLPEHDLTAEAITHEVQLKIITKSTHVRCFLMKGEV